MTEQRATFLTKREGEMMPLQRGLGRCAMADWNRHLPATTAALLAILTRATEAPHTVSQYDRILFTASEFWASARQRGLVAYLRDDAIPRLSAAESAFRAVGATKAAAILQRGRGALAHRDPLLSLQTVCTLMEAKLAQGDEPVDQLLADFAAELSSQSGPGRGR